MIATQSCNKLSNLKKDYSADKGKIYLINTFDSEKNNLSDHWRDFRSDTKSQLRIDITQFLP